MASRTRSQRQRGHAKPDVSQVVVQLLLLDRYKAPLDPQPDPLVFTGDENGTAAANAADWLTTKLDPNLEAVGTQLAARDAVAEATSELAAKTKADLRAQAKKAGLPVSGSRAELIARLAAAAEPAGSVKHPRERR